jgi:hypothetical protein
MIAVGSRFRSAVCDTEVVVVRTPASDASLWCGGRPMVPLDVVSADQPQIDRRFHHGSLLGKRYIDEESGLEVLCTKAGAGSLSLGKKLLAVKEAKLLPSSD